MGRQSLATEVSTEQPGVMTTEAFTQQVLRRQRLPSSLFKMPHTRISFTLRSAGGENAITDSCYRDTSFK